MKTYNHKDIEAKWQKKWQQTGVYEVDIEKAKKPFYNLMMFPYPSAEGLHVGSVFTFAGIDAFGRLKRMQGYDVFEPIGLDAFGIHSENHALKTNTHPMVHAEETEKNFYRQLHATGNGYDWSHTVETNKPDYYKWTQWIFLQLYKQGLVERKKAPVNWCPSCLTVLSDEQVIDGKCERCSSAVEVKDLEQWFFKITHYADRLLKNLDWINWDESVKTMQRNWIGKKVGAMITFGVENSKETIEVFTTRPDTIFGVTAVVLSPEHQLARKIAQKSYAKATNDYIKETLKTTKDDRLNARVKTGVKTGTFAINPMTKELIPIYIADYVIGSYGTGAIMLVPAHDQRDFEFAKVFDIPIKVVVQPHNPDQIVGDDQEIQAGYEQDGVLINSSEYDNVNSEIAREKIIEKLIAMKRAEKKVTYHLRDWLISRQRYWGPPIPIIYCTECGIVPVPDDQLPVKLPYIEEFRPTGTGKSPLASYPEFYNTQCPMCDRPATRETDVSDTFLDSSWYFLRYPCVIDTKQAFDQKITKKWLPVNSYIGGKEHTVLHLLYSRFITMVLHDAGLISFEEPFQQFRVNGLITKDGSKMSKSKGNVKSPDEYIERYGSDTLRLYLAFLGPFQVGGDFRDSGMQGMHRFVNRIWQLILTKQQSKQINQEERRHTMIAIKRVSKDIERLHLNTAISAIMELVNYLTDQESIAKESKQTVLQLLAPFAPHLTEELWQAIGNQYSIHQSSWPHYDEALIASTSYEIVVQINGKTRSKFIIQAHTSQEEVIRMAKGSEKIQKYIAGNSIKKTIYIPGKLVNLVI